MNGFIRIDGFCNGEYSTVTSGNTERHPDAICSLSYSMYHGIEVMDLLHTMKESIQRQVEVECDRVANELKKDRINSVLAKEGLPALTQQQLNTVFDVINNTGDVSEDDTDE